MLGDQLARGLGADAEDARDIVDRIAHQGEHVAYLFRRDAELFLDLLDVDARALHRVEHVDARAVLLADELHQVLVGRHDGHVPALCLRGPGIGGDHVVGLDVGLLDAGQREGARRIADQRELGHEVFGRSGPVRLVLVVYLVAERVARLVENHREVRRAFRLVEIFGQLPQHGGVAVDRADRRAFGVSEGRQSVIGTENVGGSVDEIEVVFIGHHGVA